MIRSQPAPQPTLEMHSLEISFPQTELTRFQRTCSNSGPPPTTFRLSAQRTLEQTTSWRKARQRVPITNSIREWITTSAKNCECSPVDPTTTAKIRHSTDSVTLE